MRTTLTLDEDVAAALERLRKIRDVSLKQLVNEILRDGLQHTQGPRKPAKAFRTRSAALGRPRIASLDNVAEALAALEAEAFR